MHAWNKVNPSVYIYTATGLKVPGLRLEGSRKMREGEMAIEQRFQPPSQRIMPCCTKKLQLTKKNGHFGVV